MPCIKPSSAVDYILLQIDTHDSHIFRNSMYYKVGSGNPHPISLIVIACYGHTWSCPCILFLAKTHICIDSSSNKVINTVMETSNCYYIFFFFVKRNRFTVLVFAYNNFLKLKTHFTPNHIFNKS